jgi:hypothetical protein
VEHEEQLFCIFDTNALRRLARLSESDWADVSHDWQERDLKTGWVPWVLAELTVSNLRQRDLSREALREIQSVVRRHDVLCRRAVLPDPYLLMWDSIWELAGREPEPYPDADLSDARRRYLDAVLALRSPAQVAVPEGEPHNLVLYNLDGESGWDHDFPATFESTAREAVGRLKEEVDAGEHASLVDAAVSRRDARARGRGSFCHGARHAARAHLESIRGRSHRGLLHGRASVRSCRASRGE